jgi:hypothetical protein
MNIRLVPLMRLTLAPLQEIQTVQEKCDLASLIIALVLLTGLMFVGIWDIFVVLRFSSAETVSTILVRWSREWPFLPLLVGLIVGHLFFPTGRR